MKETVFIPQKVADRLKEFISERKINAYEEISSMTYE
jgi:hypothetical protein